MQGIATPLWWCAFALAAGCAPAPRPVEPGAARPGLDVLVSDSSHLVAGRRVGLVTNQAGVSARGEHAVDRLLKSGVRVTALYSPEHGFRGAADPGAAVASTIDSATGLPIYSLYGRTTAPTDSMLRDVDVLLVDLQDAGARYYTYISTTLDVMRAAAGAGLPVVILDRPNPVGGAVQGNVLDTAYRTFVGRLPVPMRHGMTLAELAKFGAAAEGLPQPVVVPVAGWKRDSYLDETGLPFVPPSPNLRTVESLIHYPGSCLFEGTNLSVGRGSEAPFEQLGAPWLDTAAVLAIVRRAGLPGVRWEGVTFTPRAPGDGKYADTTLAGIRLRAVDREVYDPTAAAVLLLSAIRAAHPTELRWNVAHFDRLAGGSTLRESIAGGGDPNTIVGAWRSQLDAFETRRRPFLIYP